MNSIDSSNAEKTIIRNIKIPGRILRIVTPLVMWVTVACFTPQKVMGSVAFLDIFGK